MKKQADMTLKITSPQDLKLTAKEIERVLRNWYGRKVKVVVKEEK